MTTTRERTPPLIKNNKLACKFFLERTKDLPPLSLHQKDLLSLMAIEYETYANASIELQNYIDANKTMNVVDGKGGLQPHPSYKIQQTALASFLKIQAQLRISLGKIIKDEAIIDELGNFLGNDEN